MIYWCVLYMYICFRFTIKTQEQHQIRPFGVFIVYFEQISHPCSNLEHVTTGWKIRANFLSANNAIDLESLKELF